MDDSDEAPQKKARRGSAASSSKVSRGREPSDESDGDQEEGSETPPRKPARTAIPVRDDASASDDSGDDDDITVGKFAKPKGEQALAVSKAGPERAGNAVFTQFLRGAARRADLDLEDHQLLQFVALFEMESIKSLHLRRNAWLAWG